MLKNIFLFFHKNAQELTKMLIDSWLTEIYIRDYRVIAKATYLRLIFFNVTYLGSNSFEASLEDIIFITSR